MSELILLIARTQQWPERCLRLVPECRLYCRGISLRYNVAEISSKLLYPVPLVSRTIFRQLAWLESTKIRLPAVWSSTEARRTASSVPENALLPGADHRAEASLHLQQLLGFSASEADDCVNKFKGFAVTNSAEIPLKYEKLVKIGFSKETIKADPLILSLPLDICESKMKLLNFMNWGDINNTIPFLRMNRTSLRQFAGAIKLETTQNGGSNRVTLLAEKLQCPVMVISQIVAKHTFVQNVSIVKLNQVLQIMLDARITGEDILNDIWSLRYNTELIRERLKRVTDAGVFPVKPWMIRCPEVTLSRRIKKELRHRSVLGQSGTTIDYFTERLQCDKQKVIELMAKYPKLTQVSGPKMKKVVDFLLENGYTIEDAAKSPKILFHSTETMQERLVELKKYQHRPKSLVPFCKSKRQFEDYLRMIKLKWLKSFDQ